MDRYGLVSVSFRGLSPEDILREMKKAELSFVEWGSDVHAPKDDKTRLFEISEMQKEYGISTSSYGSYFRLGESDFSELEGYIVAAKALGTDVIRIWTSNNRVRLFQEVKMAARVAEEYGVTLSTECHMGTFTEKSEDTLALIEEAGSRRFTTYWQPFQTKSTEENLIYAKRVSSFTTHLHVFNWKGDRKFSLSEGVDEWKKYLGEFKAPRTLLLEFMPSDSIEELKTEADILKKIAESVE